MIQVEAKNEWELAEEVVKMDIDLGLFTQAFMEAIGSTLNAAQTKAVWNIMADRMKKKAVIDKWRENGELHTIKDFPPAFAEAVKRVYHTSLESFLRYEVEHKSAAFVEYFGEVYFNESGYGIILTAVQVKRTQAEWNAVKDTLET